MTPEHYTRVYLPSGTRAHLLSLGSPNSGDAALCGQMPSWELGCWYGTGGQAEYETAEDLALCSGCRKVSQL